MITTVKPMSSAHARCLAMAYELHRLLGEVRDEAGNGEGSPVESALDLMGEVVEHLEPADFHATHGAEAGPLGRIVKRQAVHALATKRWRP